MKEFLFPIEVKASSVCQGIRAVWMVRGGIKSSEVGERPQTRQTGKLRPGRAIVNFNCKRANTLRVPVYIEAPGVVTRVPLPSVDFPGCSYEPNPSSFSILCPFLQILLPHTSLRLFYSSPDVVHCLLFTNKRKYCFIQEKVPCV